MTVPRCPGNMSLKSIKYPRTSYLSVSLRTPTSCHYLHRYMHQAFSRLLIFVCAMDFCGLGQLGRECDGTQSSLFDGEEKLS